MSGVAIYMEGGGNGKDTKAALRQGMDAFLTSVKDAVRAKSWRWKLVCCGGRDEAFRAFSNARRAGEMAIVVLLVDAEGQLDGSPRAHLMQRDGWDLSGVSDDMVHLMVQTMEAWIVADSEALAQYYGQGFRNDALPRGSNLELVEKADVTAALSKATQSTKKGTYHKIRHASALLALIEPAKVKQRCPRCRHLFTVITRAIKSA